MCTNTEKEVCYDVPKQSCRGMNRWHNEENNKINKHIFYFREECIPHPVNNCVNKTVEKVSFLYLMKIQQLVK